MQQAGGNPEASPAPAPTADAAATTAATAAATVAVAATAAAETGLPEEHALRSAMDAASATVAVGASATAAVGAGATVAVGSGATAMSPGPSQLPRTPSVDTRRRHTEVHTVYRMYCLPYVSFFV